MKNKNEFKIMNMLLKYVTFYKMYIHKMQPLSRFTVRINAIYIRLIKYFAVPRSNMYNSKNILLYIYEERILGCAILFNVYTILSQRVSNTKHFTS